MTQERIAFFEQVLTKPMAEPHRSWIAELLEAAKGKQEAPARQKSKGYQMPISPIIGTPE